MQVIRFMHSILKPYKFHVLLLVIIQLLIASLQTFSPYIIKLVLDNVNVKSKYSYLIYLIIVYIFTRICIGIFWIIDNRITIKFRPAMKVACTRKIYTDILQYNYIFFQKYHSGTLVSKIKDSFNKSQDLLNLFIRNIGFIFHAISGIIIISSVHIIFSFLLLSFISILVLIVYNRSQNIDARNIVKDYSNTHSQLFGVIGDYISNILGVFLFNLQKTSLKDIDLHSEKYIKADKSLDFILIKQSVTILFIYNIYLIISITCMIYLYQHDLISVGGFALLFITNNNFIDQSFTFNSQFLHLVRDWNDMHHAIDLIYNNQYLTQISSPKKKILSSDFLSKDINIKNIHYRYIKDIPLFEDLSIQIKGGQKIGLVGYSGAGKSTLVSLLLRLYSLQKGQIFIGKHDISTIPNEILRSNIVLISQDPPIFFKTIGENISYVKSDSSQDEVILAAKNAQIHDFIMTLPNQYNTFVGERGVKLSGGEKQRMALARAFLSDAPIIILDESTSQLDLIVEKAIQNASSQLLKSSKTIIVIAHRLSTVVNLDRILVLNKGKIIEDGNHEELIKMKGLYHKIWNI